MSKHPKIILASGSQARQEILDAVGLDFTTIPADIDEEDIIERLEGRDTPLITEQLAQAKAKHVSDANPNTLVIGSDQTMEFNDQLITKAKSIDEAREKLKAMRGKSHRLYSSVCVVDNGNTVFFHTDSARLTMNNFDDEYLEAYIKKDEAALTQCVGSYRIEGPGLWLFDRIGGNHHTIMGMPLLPLLSFLRKTYKILP